MNESFKRAATVTAKLKGIDVASFSEAAEFGYHFKKYEDAEILINLMDYTEDLLGVMKSNGDTNHAYSKVLTQIHSKLRSILGEEQ